MNTLRKFVLKKWSELERFSSFRGAYAPSRVTTGALAGRLSDTEPNRRVRFVLAPRSGGRGARHRTRGGCAPHSNCIVPAESRTGFTLVELLVVIATVAVLAAVLLPALAGTKPNGQAFQCLNNTRRLTLGWTMYASENSDRLMSPVYWVSGYMTWGPETDNTNAALMLNQVALIAPYVKSAALFKCPSDIYQSPQNLGPRIRSVSLNGTLGGRPNFGLLYIVNGEAGPRAYFSAHMMSDLNKPGPANIFTVLDEHPDSIRDGALMEDAGKWDNTHEHWRDFPGSLHNNALSISYADGHSEIHKWVQSKTSQVVEYKTFSTSPSPYGSTSPLNQDSNLGKSPDNEWMLDRMPYR